MGACLIAMVNLCSYNCPEIHDPHCAEDGNFYDNPCRTHCEMGLRIMPKKACKKRKQCEKCEKENEDLTCGVNGETYRNVCDAMECNKVPFIRHCGSCDGKVKRDINQNIGVKRWFWDDKTCIAMMKKQ